MGNETQKQAEMPAEDSNKKPVRRSILLPCSESEIPSKDRLMQLGKDNLERLVELIGQVQRVLDIGDDPGLCYAKNSPFLIYDNSIVGVSITLRLYVDAIREAQEETRVRMPMIPEFRSDAWAKPGDKVVAYIVDVKSSVPARTLHPCLTCVEEVVRTNKAYFGPRVYDLRLRPLTQCLGSDSELIYIDTDLSYDSRSQYILRYDELKYLRHKREALETWMSFCGCFDPEFALGSEQRDAWRRCLNCL